MIENILIDMRRKGYLCRIKTTSIGGFTVSFFKPEDQAILKKLLKQSAFATNLLAAIKVARTLTLSKDDIKADVANKIEIALEADLSKEKYFELIETVNRMLGL